MVIVNATKHNVTLVTATGSITLPSHKPARVVSKEVPAGHVEVGGCQISVYEEQILEIRNLPKETQGQIILVSSQTADAARRLQLKRSDLYTLMGPVRDSSNQVIGARELRKVTL